MWYLYTYFIIYFNKLFRISYLNLIDASTIVYLSTLYLKSVELL